MIDVGVRDFEFCVHFAGAKNAKDHYFGGCQADLVRRLVMEKKMETTMVFRV